jgi:rhodanese-related sulfurtransferase
MTAALPLMAPQAVRAALRTKREIALIDVREEDPYAQAHPLFAVQLSAGRIELDAPWRLPRRDVTIVVYDDGEGLAEPAARSLQALGYRQVHLLAGGLQGWRDSDGELFRDVNVPSKAFGELVEHERHTPSLPADEVKALLEGGANVVVLDVRRFDEYQTMSIPGGTSVPGAELVLRVRDLAPDPATRVIVNCAGRTRSIIGTQSLVNAGVPNPVAALRNGTIGWTLAGFQLDHGAQRRFGPASAAARAEARRAAQALADRAGAIRLDAAGLAAWEADSERTLYRWDVRTPEEYAAGHRPGFGSAPGGQLVQETDVCAAVRGARIVLADDGPASDGVRAAMTAHWLAQLGWEVAWLTDAPPADLATGAWQPPGSPLPAVPTVSPAVLAERLQQGDTLLLDVATSASHAKAHIPGARWLLRADLPRLAPTLAGTGEIVVTGPGDLACFTAADLSRLTGRPVAVLDGGTVAWAAEGRPLSSGDAGLLSPRIDRYRRPYEGTDAPRAAMQGYLDWEFGLVEQLGRDGTHGFRVLAAAA